MVLRRRAEPEVVPADAVHRSFARGLLRKARLRDQLGAETFRLGFGKDGEPQFRPLPRRRLDLPP